MRANRLHLQTFAMNVMFLFATQLEAMSRCHRMCVAGRSRGKQRCDRSSVYGGRCLRGQQAKRSSPMRLGCRVRASRKMRPRSATGLQDGGASSRRASRTSLPVWHRKQCGVGVDDANGGDLAGAEIFESETETYVSWPWKLLCRITRH